MADNSNRDLDEIIYQAMQLEKQKRAYFLDNESLDYDQRRLVESLLEAHDLAGDFLEEPLLERLEFPEPEQYRFPFHIGQFKVIDFLGEGGMGSVYLALQQKPVKRKVALKTIKWGMNSKSLSARFASEYLALARLNHPHVAHFYDVDISNDKQPFFTMEYFPGSSITHFCHEHRLSLEERIQLMLQACDGAQHIHQKGIIHRDLKPSNILVNSINGKPLVKIIDFGIAKSISGLPFGDLTFQTIPGGILGTMAYLSPEQTEGPKADIDTRTDIYGLGAVFYELLTGHPPHDLESLQDLSPDYLIQRIREDIPLPPSTRLEHTNLSQDAGMPLDSRRLRGEMDWIIGRCLERDPENRYETVSKLADDLIRFQRHEPIWAAPPGRIYRLKRFARRHRTAVAMSLLCLSLVTVVAGSLFRDHLARLKLMEARSETEAKEHESALNYEKYKVLFTFITDTLAAPNPYARDRETRIADVLDELSDEITWKFADYPEIRLDLHHTLGKSYLGLGLYEKSERFLTRAKDTARRELGSSHAKTDEIEVDLAEFYYLSRKEAQCRELITELIKRSALMDRSTAFKLKRLQADTIRRQGRFQDAVQSYRILLEEGSVVGCESKTFLKASRGLALAYKGLGRWDLAEETYTEILAAQLRRLRPGDPALLTTLNNLATIYERTGRYEAAIHHLFKVLDARRLALGESHPLTATSYENLGYLLMLVGQPDEGEPLLLSAVSHYEAIYGVKSKQALHAKNNLGLCLLGSGKNVEAEGLYREMLVDLSKDDRRRIYYRNNLGLALFNQNRLADAAAIFDSVARVKAITFGDTNFSYYRTVFLQARTALGLGDCGKALELFDRVLTGSRHGTNWKQREQHYDFAAHHGIALATCDDPEGITKAREAHSQLVAMNSTRAAAILERIRTVQNGRTR